MGVLQCFVIPLATVMAIRLTSAGDSYHVSMEDDGWLAMKPMAQSRR